ncbi:hypothetical protein C8Q80DRAFT_1219897 [Daedaleopsis nitida]|nr:hypothetical protein C8Q80DRAFT_1219897 [Daedaleopsis nitida]
MDSATNKKITEQERQAEIRKQIALLQAQLHNAPTTDFPSSPDRKRPSSTVLVPETPTKKRKPSENAASSKSRTGPISSKQRPSTTTAVPRVGSSVQVQRHEAASIPVPSSTVLQKLAHAHKQKSNGSEQEAVIRSNAFTAKPPPIVSPAEPDSADASARDDNLAIVEQLHLGPIDHKPPFDDPHFEKLEPNSGIRLSSRSIPHEDFQDHLEGRYYLSPSKLYSVVRLLPNKAGYDVPVCGDWLTIAVVAERGQMKYTKAAVGISRDEKLKLGGDDHDRMDALPTFNGSAAAQGPSRPFQKRQKAQDEGAKPTGKKYVNLKLVDFGCRTRGSSADGGKAKIRGDAYLSLLLFESDSFDVVTKEDGSKRKLYRGGSRGAFERMAKLREGAVVALLNPKILKPFQRATDKPHPTENILALTPESDESIAIIGYAQDLGTCRAMKRDGTRCSSWCDKRVSDVCDYHVQIAVERRRAARPEFAAGTSGMSTSAKKRPAYDPQRQWGLRPEGPSSDTTYVVSGHVISGSGLDPKMMFLGESYGREAQAKAARKLAADSDRALKQLLSRDKEGTKALVTAREFAKRKADALGSEGKGKKAAGKAKSSKAAGKEKARAEADPAGDGEDPEAQQADSKPRKSAYSAQLIKQLGFDPTSKDGRAQKDANIQQKLDALAALQNTRTIELGRRPGQKSSCVRQPEKNSSGSSVPLPETTASERSSSPATHDDLEYADLDEAGSPLAFPDSDDDELEKEELAAFGRPMGLSEGKMIDLDDSESDS